MKISEELIKACECFGDKNGIAIDWSNENVLPYIQELCGKYVTWEIRSSVVMIILFVAITVVVGCLTVYFVKNDCSKESILLFFLITCVGIVLAISEILEIVKGTTFPELLIYEEISRHIK